MVTYLGSLVQLCCEEGGTLQTSIPGMCGECSQRMDHTGFAPAQGSVCFPGLHCSGSRLLCRALFKAGPAFRVLPRSKLLRFSDTPQGYRLGWACVLCPSQVRAAQVMRCSVSTIAATYCLPAAQLSRCAPAHLLRQMLTVQTPKKF